MRKTDQKADRCLAQGGEGRGGVFARFRAAGMPIAASGIRGGRFHGVSKIGG